MGVRVQVAAHLPELDQLRQLALPRRLQLSRVLAQLWRDVGVAEALVELRLVLRREHVAALDLGDAVLGDRQAAPYRVLAERHVVLLRAGEVLKQVAVALRRNHPEVEAKAFVRDDRRLRRPLRRHLRDPAQFREVVDQRSRVAGGRDDVEVAHRLPPTPGAAGLAYAIGGRMLAQHLDNGEQGRERTPQQRPRWSLRLPLPADGLQDVLLQLRTEPRERAQPLRPRRILQLRQRRDPELLPDLAHGLRAEAGNAQELDDLGRDDLAPLRQRLDLARLDDLDDLLLDRRADPR